MDELTKCDLSYNQVKLDYKGLKSAMDAALVLSRNELSRLYSETYNRDDIVNGRMKSNAIRLNKAARDYALICEIRDTIIGMKSRRNVDLINRDFKDNGGNE